MKAFQRIVLVFTLIGLLAAGCKTLNRTQKGAVIGAAGGGVIGGVIGRELGNTSVGVLIGAAIGGAVGAKIGNKMDQQAEEMKRVLADAEVKRIGEGILVEFKSNVLFGFDSSELTSQAEQNLGQVIPILQKYPNTNVEVIGHTDSVGSAQYNLQLSQRRAGSVGSYLTRNGVSATRVTTVGKGETDPKVPNNTEEGRAENRRVEIIITANQQMIEEARRESGQN
jgi:outer membrane protein OmpA-like peptidoglycan-associated protein